MEKNTEENVKEDAEILMRDQQRKREKEEWERKKREAEEEEERRKKEERERIKEEEIRQKRREEEWNRLGPDLIQDLPPVPPPIKDDDDPNALRAWYLDDETSKSTLTMQSFKPGRKQDAPPVTMSDLFKLGIVCFYINLNEFSIVKQIIKERLYKHTDEVRISQTAKDDTFLVRWFNEHYNEDEQLRLVLDGSCYFDIRSVREKWIRIHLQTSQLIIIPAGMYHRGTLDENDYVALFQGFQESPRFVPINRPDNQADTRKSRLNYLMKLKKGNVAAELGFHV
ncbi:unnamed protein product [Phytomonas sp. Hart1]|nr:unnamed protein product [Phytomonas sp. Hart1]|eukprot:CCW67131.1 unnamed protein product [Phytomonas sp. isolate Hart1]